MLWINKALHKLFFRRHVHCCTAGCSRSGMCSEHMQTEIADVDCLISYLQSTAHISLQHSGEPNAGVL